MKTQFRVYDSMFTKQLYHSDKLQDCKSWVTAFSPLDFVLVKASDLTLEFVASSADKETWQPM